MTKDNFYFDCKPCDKTKKGELISTLNQYSRGFVQNTYKCSDCGEKTKIKTQIKTGQQ